MIHLSYRGIHVESLRDAYIVRIANNFESSIFFDVKNIWKKAERNGSEDILLHRFERGALVPRVIYPEKGPYLDTVYFSIFGPTIIATNENIHRILESRAVQINMPEARRRFENDVIPEQSLELKERLTAFRARHLGDTLPELLRPVSSRLGDIIKPLLQIIRFVKPEREQSFLSLIRDVERERLIEKSSTLEAEILMVIIKLWDGAERGILPVKRITDEFNMERSENMKITYQRIGRRLSAMGFGKAKTNDGASAILLDRENVQRMRQSYGLVETSGTSETHES